MSPTSALYLGTIVAFAAVLLQLPKRLIELLEASDGFLTPLPFVAAAVLLLFSAWGRPPPGIPTVTGPRISWMVSRYLVAVNSGFRSARMFPEFVDHLLRQEGLRAALDQELSKLRTKYKSQQATLASLSRDIKEVCDEYNKRCREFPSVFWSRRRLGLAAAQFQETEWTEPHLWIKMCKCPVSHLSLSQRSPSSLGRLRVAPIDLTLNFSHSLPILPSDFGLTTDCFVLVCGQLTCHLMAQSTPPISKPSFSPPRSRSSALPFSPTTTAFGNCRRPSRKNDRRVSTSSSESKRTSNNFAAKKKKPPDISRRRG